MKPYIYTFLVCLCLFLFSGCVAANTVTPDVVDINAMPTATSINYEYVLIGLGSLLVVWSVVVPGFKWVWAKVKPAPQPAPVVTPPEPIEPPAPPAPVAPTYHDYTEAWLLLRNMPDLANDKDSVNSLNYLLTKVINSQVVVR